MTTVGLFLLEMIAILLGNKGWTTYWGDHYLSLIVLPVIYGSILGTLIRVLMELDNDTAYITETDSNKKKKMEFGHYCRLVFTLIGMAVLFGHFLFTVVPFEVLAQTVVRNLHFEEPHSTPLVHVGPEVKGATVVAPAVNDPIWSAPNPDDPTNPLEFDPKNYDVLTVEETSLPPDVDGTIRVTIILDKANAQQGFLIPKNRVKTSETRGEFWFQEPNKDKRKGRQSYIAPF